MMRIIIFDDGRGQLGPMTDLRASFEVRTGMLTNAGRIAATFEKSLAGYWTPPHLQQVVAGRANAPVNTLPDEETLLLINGRLAMPDPNLRVDVGTALVEPNSGHCIAACMRQADAAYFLKTGEFSERIRTQQSDERMLYRYPWDVIKLLQETIPHDIALTRILDATIPSDRADIIGDHPVSVHVSACVFPGVVIDATNGPVIVHERATIRPGAVLCGPCSIGPDATVIDRTLIKANSVIGRYCKVAGEIGGTIFQGYANKAHDGHLGDSWIGKWANLGAGTTNSNLLNTYGEVSMRIEPNGPRQRTGLTFLGAIIGDHVKTAICTRIMTGSVFGTGAMIASTAPPPTTLKRFAWLTDDGERTFRLDKFIDIARTVMARRKMKPGDAYLQLIRNLHERTVSPGGRPTR